jgi:hypothetical protein
MLNVKMEKNIIRSLINIHPFKGVSCCLRNSCDIRGVLLLMFILQQINAVPKHPEVSPELY